MNRFHLIIYIIFFQIIGIFVIFDNGAFAETKLVGQSEHIPWSGYWWPLSKGEIVNGYRGSPHPSPLEKYDLYVSGSYPGSASSWELVNRYSPSGELWWGYCNAWANATVLENIDFSVSAEDGIFFNIGDKKGLMTLLHSDDMVIVKYCNTPLYFHQYLIEYIGEHKIPIVSDLDMTGEIWSHPIYRYEMTINELSGYDDVACQIRYAADDVEPDIKGTETRFATYYYRLYKDQGGNYTGGEWVGDSISGHPEMVWVPVSQAAKNPHLDYNIIKEMVVKSDDDVEKKETISPGHHALILYPEDSDTLSFNVPAQSKMVIKLVLDPQSRQGQALPQYELRLGEDPISSGEISNDMVNIKTENNSTDNLTYELVITSDSSNQYSDFIHFYLDITFTENVFFLNATSANYWSGIAICNYHGDTNKFYATYLKTENHYPVATIPLEPSLPANANLSRVLNKSELPYDYYTEGDASILRVSSQYPMEIIGLRGDSNSLFGPPRLKTINAESSVSLVIPDLTYIFGSYNEASLNLFNQGSSEIACDIDYYTVGGDLKKEYNWTFPPEYMETYSPGKYPGDMDFGGWALLSASSNEIQGNVKYLKSGLSDEIPLLEPGTVFYLPLLAVCEGWSTFLTLFNTTENKADIFLLASNGVDKKELVLISLNPYEKKELDINTIFSNIDDTDFCNSWLKIAAFSNIAGFGTYNYKDQARASFKLFNENNFSTDVNLGLAASDEDTWWTGVLVLNTNDAPLVVSISGYDKEGQLVKTVEKSLLAEESVAITVENLFPEKRLTINSLRLHADLPVGGFALYGNKDVNYLSGIFLN